MTNNSKDEILISFLNRKDKYKQLGKYIIQLIQDDPSSPKESLHTIIFRIKDELRLIEKIDGLNNQLEDGEPPIVKENYQTRVGDLLGVRIICLRLSDVEKVETYLNLLNEEKILHFLKGPYQKRSFILPFTSGSSLPDGIGLDYSGYSSIHYLVELGENSDASKEMNGLLFELQLRTILEEAWSEIDHKYRYVRSRTGENLPEYMHAGFYNLSAYLQVAALQAENLCRMSEAYSRNNKFKFIDKDRIPLSKEFCPTDIAKDKAYRNLSTSEIEKTLKRIIQFKISPRTLAYIEKRISEVNPEEKFHKTLKNLLIKSRLLEFKTIYKDILNTQPFVNAKEGNIDLLNILNYSIFYELQGIRVAQEGLKSVLRWRKVRLNC